ENGARDASQAPTTERARHTQGTPSLPHHLSRLPNRYLSFFSLLPLISNSRFSPPNSAAPFPLSSSPLIVSLYSTVISLSMIFRSAENVRVRSLSFSSLSFVSF